MRVFLTSVARSVALWVALSLTACHAHLPSVSPARRARRPLPMTVAIPPLLDERESGDDEELFLYQGTELVHTNLDRLERSPSVELTELFARVLLEAGAFARIILVDRIQDAPEADLVLSGKIRRARGYVEAKARKDDPRLLVMAEVLFSDVELRSKGDIVLSADLGWSIAEDRTGDQDPYALLSEASSRTVDQLVGLLEQRALSPLPKSSTLSLTSTSASIDELVQAAPEGWRVVETSVGAPAGWRTRDSTRTCRWARFEMLGRISFHRAVGPYVPSVSVWVCAPTARLVVKGEGSATGPLDFPARYRGRAADGSFVFALSIGKSSWAAAEEQLVRSLGVTPPSSRYVFEVP
ncbi:MAG: hypothetical protein HY791_27565 [Deltaproteobacteria bacterium]|nr:hypothetical protein [Deltaproteobacteria bacterium]